MNFEFPLLALPAFMRGPRVERRRVLIGGTAFWGTMVEEGAEAGRLRLDDGRLVDAESAAYLPPVAPSKIIAVHISYSSRSVETRNKPKPTETPTYFTKPPTSLNGHGGRDPEAGRLQVPELRGRVRDRDRQDLPQRHAGRSLGLHRRLLSRTGHGAAGLPRNRPGIDATREGRGHAIAHRARHRARREPVRANAAHLVNGMVAQEAHIGEETIWGPHYVIADIARHITLVAGDVILMGTPCHSRSVDPGDVVECEITNIGRVSGTVTAINAPRAAALSVGHMPTDTPEVRRVALGFDERVPERFKQNLLQAHEGKGV